MSEIAKLQIGENTFDISEFGKFKIKKESSSSAGVRRIKAIFEKD